MPVLQGCIPNIDHLYKKPSGGDLANSTFIWKDSGKSILQEWILRRSVGKNAQPHCVKDSFIWLWRVDRLSCNLVASRGVALAVEKP